MKKVAVAIGLIVLLVLLLIVFSVGIFGRTAVTPTPTPTTPTATPQPTPTLTPTASQVIITAQELITQLQANPNRYKKGTIFQITGVILENVPFAEYLGPETNGWVIKLQWVVGEDNGLAGILPGTSVVVRGEYEIAGGKTVLFKNSSLVSRNRK